MNRFDDPRKILDRIVASPCFPQTSEAAYLLHHICEQTQAGHTDALREHDIGVEVLGLEPGYDVAANPAVRSLVDEIRAGLKNYFSGEGKREPLRLAIPAGEFRAYFYEARAEDLAAAEAEPSAFDLFWEPHFAPATRNVLIHGEQDGRIEVAEAHSLVRLAVLFASRGLNLEIHSSANSSEEETAGASLILTGTLACNAVLAGQMKEAPAGATVRRLPGVTILTGPDADSILEAARFVTEEEWLTRKAARFVETGFPVEFDLVVRAARGS